MTPGRGWAWNLTPLLPDPPCVLCVGGSVVIKDGCKRCAGTGQDPDSNALPLLARAAS